MLAQRGTEEERERERGGRGNREGEREKVQQPCRRLGDVPEGTALHRLSTNIVTRSRFSVALSQLPYLTEFPVHLSSSMTRLRVDPSTFNFLPRLICDLWCGKFIEILRR